MNCRQLHRRLITEFSRLDAKACREAVTLGDFSRFEHVLSPDLRAHVQQCSDCSNDVLWLLQIRDEVDLQSFPCVHLAYGCSTHAGRVINRHLGLFSIVTGLPDQSEIIIGYCPWCGIELNVSASFS